MHRELKRKHVTLLILWNEYTAANPVGYSYSRFCELYRSFEKTLSVTMRQTHAAGERLFVDYAGDGVPVVIDRLTGEIRMAQIFVAVLGASSFTFAKATWTQALPDWIDAHVRAFEAIGGVPELVVPDNARTAIVKASFYDPQVNRSYAEMAAHYRTAILPARASGAPAANNSKRLDRRPAGEKTSLANKRGAPGGIISLQGGGIIQEFPGRNNPVTDGRLRRNRRQGPEGDLRAGFGHSPNLASTLMRELTRAAQASGTPARRMSTMTRRAGQDRRNCRSIRPIENSRC